MRILHVDDNYDVSETVRQILRRANFTVDHAGSTCIADEMVSIDEYDLILLDVRLPDASGIDFCSRIRERGVGIPVMMLTVLAEPENRVTGLECGADDYLSKPFHSGELVARIRALLRRRIQAPTPILQISELRLDPARQAVCCGSQRIDLLPKEFAILEYLMINAGVVRRKDQIGENVWGIAYDPRSNIIESYISRIRRKISDSTGRHFIETVKGVGYRVTDSSSK